MCSVVLSSEKIRQAPHGKVVANNERCFTQRFCGSVPFVNTSFKKPVRSAIFVKHRAERLVHVEPPCCWWGDGCARNRDGLVFRNLHLL